MDEGIHIVCRKCNRENRVPQERLGDRPVCGECRELLFDGKPLELTKDNFDAHVGKSGIPVVVDFWAPWCMPCRAMAPFFEKAAAQLEPKVRLAKVNTDKDPELAARFEITGIPALMAFRNGELVKRQAGAMNLADLVRWIESAVL